MTTTHGPDTEATRSMRGAWSYWGVTAWAYDTALVLRFSRDPIEEEGGINIYAFVLNDAVNFFDPFGLTGIPYPGRPGWFYFSASFDLSSMTGSYWGPPGPNNQQCASGAQYLCGTKKNGVHFDAPKTRTWAAGPGIQAAWDTVNGSFMAATFQGAGGTYLNTNQNSPKFDHTIIVTKVANGCVTYYDQFAGQPLTQKTEPVAQKAGFSIVLSKEEYDPDDCTCTPRKGVPGQPKMPSTPGAPKPGN